MKLLAVDTSTEICSVALMTGKGLLEHDVAGMRHAETILPAIQTVLAEAGITLKELDGIAFGRGPGSFTSLRIGASVVQGIAYGADLPVVPVSSLAALAQGGTAMRQCAALDARMDQVYVGMFQRDAGGLVVATTSERVCSPAEVELPAGKDWVGVGSGWDQYSSALERRLGDRIKEWLPGQFPRARSVATLAAPRLVAGDTLPAEMAVPVYIRDDVARKANP